MCPVRLDQAIPKVPGFTPCYCNEQICKGEVDYKSPHAILHSLEWLKSGIKKTLCEFLPLCIKVDFLAL